MREPEPVANLPNRVAQRVPNKVMSSLNTYGFQTQGHECCERLWQSLRRIIDEHCARIDREIDDRRARNDAEPELFSKYVTYADDLFNLALGKFRDRIWNLEVIDPQRQAISCAQAENHFHLFGDALESAKLAIVVDWQIPPRSKAAQRRRAGRDLPYGLNRLFGWGL